MKYRIKTHKTVDKFLQRHPEVVPRFFKHFEKIAESPFFNTCDIKLLMGEKNHYRLRIGKYRFLYEIIDDQILIYVYDGDSRGDIYK